MIHALVLSGGGAYAAYEVGVIAALCRGEAPTTFWERIDPTILCGTSAGSLNAAVLASRPDLDANAAVEFLESVWYDELAGGPDRCGTGVFRARGDIRRLLEPACTDQHTDLEFERFCDDSVYLAGDLGARTGRFLSLQTTLAGRIVQMFNLASFVNPDPYREALARVLSPLGIQRSYRALRIPVTDWRLGRIKLFANEDMTAEHAVDIVMASSAIPGFFPPVALDGEVYVDGGVLMNTPLSPAIDACADMIHVIYMDPDVSCIELDRLQNTVSTLERILLTQRAQVINQDCDLARRINQGLDAIESMRRGGSREIPGAVAPFAAAMLLRAAEKSPYRKITIHRYHPRSDLGGLTGIFDVSREQIDHLIQLGYRDAVNHDCGEQECVLATGERAPFRFAWNAEAAARELAEKGPRYLTR